MDNEIFELKGEMSLLNVLLMHSTDLTAIARVLRETASEAHQLLDRSPVVVDCQPVAEQAAELDFLRLKNLLLEAGLVPVGVRNLADAPAEQAAAAGWPVLRPGRSQTRTPPVKNKPTAAATEPVQRLKVIDRPVRSGQQIYCPEGDIVVMQHTSAGSELLAGGSVHVYGALRGRVLVGIQGDTEARIFCRQLEAELVAIAGRYRLFDDIDPELKGQAVMVYLEGEKLKIVPI